MRVLTGGKVRDPRKWLNRCDSGTDSKSLDERRECKKCYVYALSLHSGHFCRNCMQKIPLYKERKKNEYTTQNKIRS